MNSVLHPSASSRRDIPSHSSLLPRPPRHFVATLRRILPRHVVATLRRSAPRPVELPQFNRRGPTSQTFNRAVVFQLHPFPCSCSDGIPSVANADSASRALLAAKFSSYLQLLQTVNTQTLKIQTVLSRLQLQQLLLLGYCIIVGLAYEVFLHF